eukprot:PLAT12543.6.p2 GENE.PLAT12543.6~~PLAT12543.6.p2  ORF type:complete len:111 (+),score=27.49 PLAT12543.6:26-334(+)
MAGHPVRSFKETAASPRPASAPGARRRRWQQFEGFLLIQERKVAEAMAAAGGSTAAAAAAAAMRSCDIEPVGCDAMGVEACEMEKRPLLASHGAWATVRRGW